MGSITDAQSVCNLIVKFLVFSYLHCMLRGPKETENPYGFRDSREKFAITRNTS